MSLLSLKSRVRRLEIARAATKARPFDRAEALRLARLRASQRTEAEIAADRAETIASLEEPDLPDDHPAAALQRGRRRVARLLLGSTE